MESNTLCRYFTRLRAVAADGHFRELLGGASVAFTFRIFGTVAAFLSNLVLARTFGAADVGLFFLAVSVVEVLAMTGRLGLAQSAIAFVGRHGAMKDWSAVKGAFRQSILYVTLASMLISLLTAWFAPILAKHLFGQARLVPLLRIISLSILPVALFNVFGNSLKGLRQIQDSQFVITFCQQLSFLGGVFVVMLFPSLRAATWLYVLSTWLTATWGFALWRKRTPELAGVSGTFPVRQLFATAMPLFLTNVMMIVSSRAGNFVLGILATPADVGVYNIAFRVSALTNFVLMAVNTISAPKFAALHGQGDMRGLARVARQSTALVIVGTLPLLVAVFLLPEKILGLFGVDFVGHGAVLAILAAGQCINVAAGPVGMLLAMTGKERRLRNLYLITAPLNLFLLVVLVPYFSAVGAAWATSLSIVLLNCAATYIIKKEFGFTLLPVRLVYSRKVP